MKFHVNGDVRRMVLIDLPMPSTCDKCLFNDHGGCYITKGIILVKRGKTRPDWCPIKAELPAKHGRLIEAPQELSYAGLVYIYPTDFRAIAAYFLGQIEEQPTVIEAEDEE